MWRVRQALRHLLRHPLSTAVVAVMVGSSVAVNCTLFAVVDSLLFKPLPFPEPGQLVAIGHRGGSKGRPTPMSPREFRQLRDARALAGVAALGPSPLDQDGAAASEEGLRGATVSEEYIDVLGVHPFIGRALEAVDAGQSQPLRIVIGHALWKGRLAGDPTILQHNVRLGGRLCRVVGVMPAGFNFPDEANVWAALPPPATQAADNFAHLRVIGRLHDGMTPAAVGRLFKDVVGQDLTTNVRPEGARSLGALLIASSLVLLITWVQVGALQVGRSLERTSEVRLRLALGASRRHLFAGFACEGAILAAAALILAWTLTVLLIGSLAVVMPSGVTPAVPVTADLRTFFFASILSVAGVLLFAIAPLASLVDVGLESTGAATGVSRATNRRLASFFAVAQVAATAALVYLASLTVRSYVAVSAVDLGFDAAGLVAVPLSAGGTGAARRLVTLEQFEVIRGEVARLPGVVSVAGASARPLSAARTLVGLAAAHGERPSPANLVCLTPGYLGTVGTPILRGRDFAAADGPGGSLACILNETASRRLGADVGRAVFVGGLPVVVVGVASDSVLSSPDEVTEPQVYVPAAQWLAPSLLVARVRAADPSAAATRIRDTVARALGVPPARVTSLEAEADRATKPHRDRVRVLVALSGIGLLLSSIGVYAGMSHAVFRRRHQLAVRSAVGASPAVLARDVLSEVAAHVGAGIAVGGLAGIGAGRLLASVLFGVRPLDLTALAATAVSVICASLAAAALPAAQAGRVDPTQLLRDN